MNITSSVANFSQSQFYRYFYKGDENARVSENRTSLPKSQLITSDGNALSRAIQTLGAIYERSDTSGKEIFNAIRAFGDTYNNMINSSGETDNREIVSLRKSIKNLSGKQKKDLEAVGISIEDSGKLKIDEDKLKDANPTRVKKLFSDDSDFMKQLKSYAKKMSSKGSGYANVIDSYA